MAMTTSRRGLARLRLFQRALLPLGVFVVGACNDLDPTNVDSAPGQRAPMPNPAVPTNPFAGVRLYVEPSNHALTTAAAWRSTRPADAALMERIGNTAQAVWFNGWQADVQSATSQYVNAAASAGGLPVLVAYNIPQRDCGAHSAGGAASAESYLAWMRSFAAGIGSQRAVVILEPDALAGLNCLSATDRAQRIHLLKEAVQMLKANTRTSVYLDAGHARWIGATEMAARLIAANVAKADGFALNVSNFVWDSENVSYGEQLSALIGGQHFVIDTSRNGQGPAATSDWCNPQGRGLGLMPTVSTGHSLVDALLWIKRPGESDGSCNGGPAAGKWWADYALDLAQRATTLLALN